ncbi:MAG: translation initiation factor IF-2 N-terminal domain-containing protein [Actinomycetes bacterium]
MSSTHVVVDGSNLATEGRTLPSLVQLEEAIEAYAEEHPGVEIIVVVDATFEHRIEAAERDRLKEAELHGEVVSPPAGAIGRGDAFVLKIAKRTGAVVLSNDSFQEFHGEHPWLFEEGRLVGGKPVTNVGWIFTPRTPVRGPKSRAATKAAGRRAPAGPTKKLAVKRPDGSTPKVGDVLTPAAPLPPEAPKKIRAYELAKELGIENKALLALAKKAKVAVASHSSSISPEDAQVIREALSAEAANRKIRAYELAKELGIDNKALLALAKKAKVAVASHSSSILETDAVIIRKAATSAAATSGIVAAAADDLEATQEDATGSPRRRRRRRRSGGAGGEETAAPESATKTLTAKKQAGRPRKASAPEDKPANASPAPINEPLDLVSFLATFEAGSEFNGVVATFTSHGAMVDVGVGGERTFRCYAPTVRLGDPAPMKARDVLTKGEARQFRVVSVDPSRRVAEIELV